MAANAEISRRKAERRAEKGDKELTRLQTLLTNQQRCLIFLVWWSSLVCTVHTLRTSSFECSLAPSSSKKELGHETSHVSPQDRTAMLFKLLLSHACSMYLAWYSHSSAAAFC